MSISRGYAPYLTRLLRQRIDIRHDVENIDLGIQYFLDILASHHRGMHISAMLGLSALAYVHYNSSWAGMHGVDCPLAPADFTMLCQRMQTRSAIHVS